MSEDNNKSTNASPPKKEKTSPAPVPTLTPTPTPVEPAPAPAKVVEPVTPVTVDSAVAETVEDKPKEVPSSPAGREATPKDTVEQETVEETVVEAPVEEEKKEPSFAPEGASDGKEKEKEETEVEKEEEAVSPELPETEQVSRDSSSTPKGATDDRPHTSPQSGVPPSHSAGRQDDSKIDEVKEVEQKPAPKSIPKAKKLESRPVVKPALSFLDKLKGLRVRANQKRSEGKEENLKKIMEYAIKTQRVTNNDVERITGVSDRQALYYLKELVKDKKLVRFGKAKNCFYKPIAK